MKFDIIIKLLLELKSEDHNISVFSIKRNQTSHYFKKFVMERYNLKSKISRIYLSESKYKVLLI